MKALPPISHGHRREKVRPRLDRFYGAERGFDLCDATGKRIKRVSFSSLPGFSRRTHPGSVTFLDDHQIILFVCDSSGTESAAAIKYDLDNDKHEVLFQQQEFGLFAALGAVAADRKHAVIVTGMGLNAVVIDMATGKSVARCGSLTPLPTWVGWAKPGKGNQFAWSEADERRFRQPQADSLEYGFDLDQMQLLPAISTDDFSVAKTEHEDWGFERDKEGGGRWVTKAGKPVEGESNSHVNISAFTMVPRGDQPPLVAWANRGLLQASGNIHLEEVEGDGLVMLKPKVVCCQALAPSPDGRLLVASTGTHQIVIYATSGRDTPLLSFARVNGEWVIWSPEGYFAASPGGEKLIGWAVNDGPDKLAKFYPAAQFGSYFRRSDLLQQVIEQITSAKVKDAIESRGVNLDKLQLPVVDMRVLKQTAETLEVMVKATSKVNDQPVTSLRLLLNGRPMANGQGVKQFAGNELAEATFSIRLPPGRTS